MKKLVSETFPDPYESMTIIKLTELNKEDIFIIQLNSSNFVTSTGIHKLSSESSIHILRSIIQKECDKYNVKVDLTSNRIRDWFQ